MPRELSQFNGRYLLIGGGWSAEHRQTKPYEIVYDDFYTIDVDFSSEADAIFNIEEIHNWAQFQKNSFDFIFFENIPLLENIEAIFKECSRIISDSGIIFYKGGSRFLSEEYRSIPDLLHKANFPHTIIGRLYFDFQDKFKFDKGSNTLASKDINSLTKGYIQQNLPEKGSIVIKSCNFFDLEATYNRNGLFKLPVRTEKGFGVHSTENVL